MGLSSCDAVRTSGANTAAVEDFLGCTDKACFTALVYTHLIDSERHDDGGERVIYATWSPANWKNTLLEKSGKTPISIMRWILTTLVQFQTSGSERHFALLTAAITTTAESSLQVRRILCKQTSSLSNYHRRLQQLQRTLFPAEKHSAHAELEVRLMSAFG